MPAPSTERTERKRRCTFSVAMSRPVVEQIDRRVARINQAFPLTRSFYLELLARHDQEHKVIEKFLEQLAQG